MKITLIILMLLPLKLLGQDSIRLDSVIVDSSKSICDERGHVMSGTFMKTLMYCAPYTIDNENETIMVYPACNTVTYTCGRCGKRVSEPEKERRVTIWSREGSKFRQDESFDYSPYDGKN